MSGKILFRHAVSERSDAMFQRKRINYEIFIFKDYPLLHRMNSHRIRELRARVSGCGNKVVFDFRRRVNINGKICPCHTARCEQPNKSENLSAVHGCDKDSPDAADAEAAA